ncbi:MAG: TolB family protein [Pyrinomonadaceae bacterium]
MLLLLTVLAAATAAAQTPAGEFEGQTDVGGAQKVKPARFDSRDEAYGVEGSGTNMWGARDEFHFVWRRMRGDFILTARALFAGRGKEAHRKLGWQVRSTLDADSPHASAVVHGDGLTSLQFRRTKGAETEEVKFERGGADVIQLERRGDTFIMSAARFGETFVTRSVERLPLGEEVYVGLFVCSHDKDVTEHALFDSVRVTVPAPAGLVPYRDYLGSRLEIFDVAAGRRRVVHTIGDSVQAPNWTRDGRALVYNRNGRLYRFDLRTKAATEIDTGFATSNNNDHVLSFDGRWLGISHHPKEDDGRSVVYVLPAEGGTPRRVTARSPSYLHGWSPDGKFLVYTGERNGEFDIYRIAAEGGEETRLTDAKGLDDGPEYSPDGRYVYFNSTRAGRMQLWRMRADGTRQEQLTDDEFNNWFPHLSPDGRWIVFISFGEDVRPEEHPFYKHVYVRLMPASGGPARVLAYVYGGQGTINVPSWSPDGKRFAFVSNTKMN